MHWLRLLNSHNIEKTWTLQSRKFKICKTKLIKNENDLQIAITNMNSGSCLVFLNSGSGKKTDRNGNQNNFTQGIWQNFQFSSQNENMCLKDKSFRTYGAKFHFIDVLVISSWNYTYKYRKNWSPKKSEKYRFFNKHNVFLSCRVCSGRNVGFRFSDFSLEKVACFNTKILSKSEISCNL